MRTKSWPIRLLLTGACIGLAWFAYVAAVRGIGWYFVYKLVADSPNIGAIPKPLDDSSIAPLTGVRVEQFGFSFQVPWNDEPIRKGGNAGYLLTFRNGRGILVFNPSAQIDTAKLMKEQLGKGQHEMTEMLGATNLESNYNFTSAKLRFDPKDFVPWASKDQWVRGMVLLPLKSVELGKTTAIYEMNFGVLRGFQLGDPHIEKQVHLELFDDADREYSIVIVGKTPLESSISQAEINALAASIRPLPPPPATPAKILGM